MFHLFRDDLKALRLSARAGSSCSEGQVIVPPGVVDSADHYDPFAGSAPSVPPRPATLRDQYTSEIFLNRCGAYGPPF